MLVALAFTDVPVIDEDGAFAVEPNESNLIEVTHIEVDEPDEAMYLVDGFVLECQTFWQEEPALLAYRGVVMVWQDPETGDTLVTARNI